MKNLKGRRDTRTSVTRIWLPNRPEFEREQFWTRRGNMKLQGDDIFSWVESAARQAERFVIVSPFFTMDRDGNIRRLLESPADLKVLIGDEFSTNDPGPLEELSELASADIRCVYRNRGGENRLHAKVFHAVEPSGRHRALVGSANFTVSGLRRNKEQAVSFDSDCEADRPILEQIESWIEELDKRARKIDWEWAKREYERSSIPHFHTGDFDDYRRGQAENYWVLKATEGSHGKPRWREFVRENVVSIGWEDIVGIVSDEEGIQPSEYTLERLIAAAEGLSYGRSSRHAAKTLYWFSRIFSIGDRIIVCRGYGGLQSADVHLYGLAVVDDDVVDDRRSDWWRLKRRAVFRRENRNMPKDVFVKALGKGSLLQTIHRIKEKEYEEFCRRIEAL